jgi:HSP20 family protein
MKRRYMLAAPVAASARTATTTTQPFGELFETLMGRDFFDPTRRQRDHLSMSSWQDDNSITVEVDLPGVKLADVSIEVHNKVLTISAKRTSENREGGWDNRHYGDFVEKLQLPDTVNESAVEAKLAHGVLNVKLPKVEQPKPRKVSIQVEG